MEKTTKRKESLQQLRVFSESIRKQTVRDIENGRCTVTQASRELHVSIQSIYKWIHRYSRYLSSNKKLVVEDKSEAYRTKELEARIKDLEAALGRKQLELDYLNKLIEIAGKDLGTDLKKNIVQSHLTGLDGTKIEPTDTK